MKCRSLWHRPAAAVLHQHLAGSRLADDNLVDLEFAGDGLQKSSAHGRAHRNVDRRGLCLRSCVSGAARVACPRGHLDRRGRGDDGTRRGTRRCRDGGPPSHDFVVLRTGSLPGWSLTRFGRDEDAQLASARTRRRARARRRRGGVSRVPRRSTRSCCGLCTDWQLLPTVDNKTAAGTQPSRRPGLRRRSTRAPRAKSMALRSRSAMDWAMLSRASAPTDAVSRQRARASKPASTTG